MPAGLELVQFIVAFTVEACRMILKQIFHCYVAPKFIRRVASSSMTALSVGFAFMNSPQHLEKGVRWEQADHLWVKAAPVEQHPLADLG